MPEGQASIADARLDKAIAEAAAALKALQKADGHWVFELEADATIPAEYVMLGHYLGEIDAATYAKIAVYLRDNQAGHGGWALYYGGDFNLSTSVKAYYALKLCGDSPEAPHMRRAREAIYAAGGAARCNVFTRFTLALFEQIPWRGVPVMPVEIMLLPRWFPFHLEKVSYWSRTVIVPLLLLSVLKPKAKNPRGVASRSFSSSRPKRCRTTRPIPRAPPWASSSWRSTSFCVSPSPSSPKGGGARRWVAPSIGSPSASTARTGSAASIRPWRTP